MLCKHRQLPTGEETYELMKSSANTGSETQASHILKVISLTPSLLKESTVAKTRNHQFNSRLGDHIHLFPGWYTPCSSRHQTLLDPRRSHSALGMSRSYTHHICAPECRAAHRSRRSRICHHLQVQQSLWLQDILSTTLASKRKSFLVKQLACTLKDNTIELQKLILQGQGVTPYLHPDLRETRWAAYSVWFLKKIIHAFTITEETKSQFCD